MNRAVIEDEVRETGRDKEKAWVYSQSDRNLPDGQYQNQIIFFVAKDGEALYSQQKQDQEPTVAQIMNFLFFLLPNSELY